MLTPYKNAVVQDNLKDTDPITSGAARENNPNLAAMKQYYKGEGGVGRPHFIQKVKNTKCTQVNHLMKDDGNNICMQMSYQPNLLSTLKF